MQLNCAAEELPSNYSTIEVAGSFLTLSNITMNGSWSATDGGSIKAYAGAVVQVGPLAHIILMFEKPA